MSIEPHAVAPYPRGVAGKRRAPTAPDAPHDVLVTGLTAAEVAALDAIVDRRRAELAAEGATTSRNAVIARLVREFIARDGKPRP